MSFGDIYPGKVAIVVPVYKPFELCSEMEIKSLKRVTEVLNGRPILFIHGVQFNPKAYLDFMAPLEIKCIAFQKKYFNGHSSYNRLCLSKVLYDSFLDFDYILIHQLDAFVFKDDLDYWCNQGYDYIGAPWFKGTNQPSFPLEFNGSGNGGFSLRKVQSFRKIASKRYFVQFHKLAHYINNRYNPKKYPLLQNNILANTAIKYIRNFVGWEDEFYGRVVPKIFPWFKVAQPQTAMKFSFEVMPDELFKMNNNQLPFGCHAWETYNRSFWIKFIEAYS
ncbi:DUF5672 family protein [Arcticibacter eurypsychrophilus]|uniref:DUF5672 family protein n=1 Tax=Arcticibacter eurypsychrophilus TaxID=1434752 RepID=UPI00084DDB6E|nr:DUF5672 family protein [Arcticibacter eurypsychrophilus]